MLDEAYKKEVLIMHEIKYRVSKPVAVLIKGHHGFREVSRLDNDLNVH